MKLKYSIGLVLGIILFVLCINIFTIASSAIDDSYHISIKDTSAKYLKTRTHGDYEFPYYDISITLHNSGNVPSDNITVKLRDEDGNYTKEVVINPGEDKTVVFNEHIFWGKIKRTVHFEYYATELDKRNIHNSGSTTLIINPDKSGASAASTPGFEVLIVLIGIIFVLIMNKRKKGL